MTTIEQWTPQQMRERLADVMKVYRVAFLDVHERHPERAQRDRAAHALAYLERPAFRVHVALDGDAVVGIAYGQPGRPGQWWHDVVAAALPRAVAAAWLSDCFEVVELHVLPAYQGAGLGRQLLQALLTGVSQQTAALSALDLPGSRARRLYAGQGFIPLLSAFRFPGGDIAYAILAKRLREPG